MINKNLDVIYNKKYLTIVPKMLENLLEDFEYSFGNTILMNNTIDDINKVTEFINNNNFEQIIFVDYQTEYEEVINNLIKKHTIKFIFTKSLGALSDSFIMYTFNGILNLYKNGIIEKLGLLDKGLYETLKNKNKNVEYIILDRQKKSIDSKYNQAEIGIINNENNPRHSFYNELSAIKLTNKYKAKLANYNKTTKHFLKLFNIPSKKVIKEYLLYNNLLNLYINFTDNDFSQVLKSMDANVPCIVGNTNKFDKYSFLKEMLVMKSDDDIDEISEKIEIVSQNREKIINEYQKFRKEYSKESKKSIEKFTEVQKDIIEEKENELLLTVIVPVYNTEKYLEKSLDSIINASIKNMEILIINDGSTDNSEQIIKRYVEKYPNLIRYIYQENHGLGNVRNVGLKEAKGKFIASIDSDDTININFFEKAMPYLEKDIDVVIYDWLTVTNEESYPTDAKDWIFNNKEWNNYEGLLYTTIMPSACNKIVKKSLFDKLEIKYIEDKFEDLSTTPFILLEAQTIKYIHKPYYEYFIRSNSIMRTKPGYSMIDILKIVDNRLKKYEDIINVDINTFKYYTYSWRIEEYIINQLYTIDEEEIEGFIDYIYKNIKDIILEVFNNDKYKDIINQLDEKDKNYIEDRNKAIQKNTLEQFIKTSRKNNNYFKLTPSIIYYGYKKDE